MRFSLIEKLRGQLSQEKIRLETGERPPSRFREQTQRTAVKALAIFFALMILLTIFSRMAEGATVAKVSAEGIQSGILTERVNASGNIEALGDVNLSLPAGLDVEKVQASVGQQVKKGDPLVQLNLEQVRDKINSLQQEINLLDLKMQSADKGNTSESAELIAEAKLTLQNAKEDYETAKEGSQRSVQRAEEDLEEAENALKEANAELEEIKVKALEERIKKASEELEAAQENLETAKESREDAIDAAEAAIESAKQSGSSQNQAYQSAEAQLTRAMNALDEAQIALQKAQESGDADAIAAAQAAVDNALANYDEAKRALEAVEDSITNNGQDLQNAREELKKVTERWDKKVEKAEVDVAEKEELLAKAKNSQDVSEEASVIAGQGAVESAEQSVKNAKRAVEDADSAAETQMTSAQRAVDSASRGVTQAENKAGSERKTSAEARQQAQIEKLEYLSEKRAKEKDLETLNELAQNEGILVSPIDGSVMAIMEETGITQDGQKLAVISRKDRGFAFTAKLPEKEAQNLHVGDQGTLNFSADGKSHTANVAVTAVSPTDEEGNVTITAQLGEENFGVGTASMEITRQSEQYGSVLPLSALRNDSKGDFVLVMQEKKSVMGNVQTAVRVPVQVLDKDSDKMAVESSLLPEDKIITDSSKPISEGDKVRLDGKGQ